MKIVLFGWFFSHPLINSIEHPGPVQCVDFAKLLNYALLCLHLANLFDYYFYVQWKIFSVCFECAILAKTAIAQWGNLRIFLTLRFYVKSNYNMFRVSKQNLKLPRILATYKLEIAKNDFT